MTPWESSKTSMPSVFCMSSFSVQNFLIKYFTANCAAAKVFRHKNFSFSIAFFIDSSPLPSLSYMPTGYNCCSFF